MQTKTYRQVKYNKDWRESEELVMAQGYSWYQDSMTFSLRSYIIKDKI